MGNYFNYRKRCLKYHIQGERKGLVDKFIDNLPGPPDNIRFDGEGHYWIALAMVIQFLLLILHCWAVSNSLWCNARTRFNFLTFKIIYWIPTI